MDKRIAFINNAEHGLIVQAYIKHDDLSLDYICAIFAENEADAKRICEQLGLEIHD